MKTCSKCKTEKEESEFCKDSRRKDKLTPWCKACQRESGAKRRLNNKDKDRERTSRWYRENKDRVREREAKRRKDDPEKERSRQRAWVEKNREKHTERIRKYKKDNAEAIKERAAKYRQRNHDKVLQSARRFREEHREELRDYFNNYKRARNAEDPIFAARLRVHNLTSKAFKRGGYTKRSITHSLVGISSKDLLEIWGVTCIPDGYHIDHIVPLAQAQTIQEVEQLCHWSNLQLLPAEENLKKNAKKTEQNAELCVVLLGRDWID
jgi:hypothetical protein